MTTLGLLGALATALALLMPAGPAPAACRMPDGPTALSMVEYPSPWPITFAGPRRGYLGVTNLTQQRITIYLRCGLSEASVATTIAHEIGHAVDWTMNSEEDRRRWMGERGITPRPWFPAWGARDFASPAGDFAEVFAWFHAPRTGFKSRLGPVPASEPAGYWNEAGPPATSPTTTTTALLPLPDGIVPSPP